MEEICPYFKAGSVRNIADFPTATRRFFLAGPLGGEFQQSAAHYLKAAIIDCRPKTDYSATQNCPIQPQVTCWRHNMRRVMRPSADDEVLTPEERIAFMIDRVRQAAYSATYQGRARSLREKADHLAVLFEEYRKGTLAAAPKYVDAKVGELTVTFFHADAPHGEERTYEGSPGAMTSESPRQPLPRR